jgi:hypothetical protein
LSRFDDGRIFQSMPSSGWLAGRDVDGVLSVLGVATASDGVQPFELPLVQRLVELIPAVDAG